MDDKDRDRGRVGKSWKKEREEREKKRNVKSKENKGCDLKNEKMEQVHENIQLSVPTNMGKLAIKESLKETLVVDVGCIDNDIEERLTEEKERGEEMKKLEKEEQIRKEKADELRKKEEEKEFLETYIKELKERLSKRKELRDANIAAGKDRQELNTAKLDSSLKKNTAFIKKMRNMTESQQESLEKDLLSLNLSKYISELAQAVVDSRLKMADIVTAVSLCSLLHQRYQDFSPVLFQNWQKLFSGKKEDKFPNLGKLRVDLRLYAELVSAGIFTPKEGLPLLGNILTTLVHSDKEGHQNMSILLTFCKYCGEEYMGLVPRKIRNINKQYNILIPQSTFLPTERQKNVRGLLKQYYSSLLKHLITDHKEIQKVERQNQHILQSKGELSDERKTIVENMNSALIKLMQNTETLAELLDEDVPEMPQLKMQEEDEMMIDGIAIVGDGITTAGPSLWEDEDTKSFYMSLPQLKALLPSILYQESEKATSDLVKEDMQDVETPTDDEFLEVSEEQIIEDEEEEPLPPDLPVEEEIDDGKSSSTKVLLEGFLNDIPHCISRDLIDAAALEFCHKLNTKPCRKKLVKAIFLVPRTRLDLLPFYSRLVASLQPLMPDLAIDLVQMLRQDFRYQVKKKDQINIESKIKVVRFIGELTKFSIYPKSEAIMCLRMLLMDFNHHQIEMACNLLETCGRFLYRSVESHHRTKIYLEQMMRKKTVKTFDPRYNTMIENAYYYVNPPDVCPDMLRQERPPLQQYIRSLLYDTLYKINTEKILKQIRKLPWDDPEVSGFTVSCLVEVWNAKFYNIRCIANLLAGLISYHDWVGTAVVDATLEDIRLGMEINEPKFNQRRVAAVKYLGELYNYRVIESSVIFKVLYSLITFGVSYDPAISSDYDPPFHLMRIHLVCILLDTCGQFFSSGASKRKLDCYITYFQHYYLLKHSLWLEEEFPWDIEHRVQDTILNLRPKITMFEDLKEAQDAIWELQHQISNKALQHVPGLKEYFDDTDAEQDGLTTIKEESNDSTQLKEISSQIDDLFVEVEDEEEDEDREKGHRGGDDEGDEIGGDSLNSTQTPSQQSESQRGNLEDEENDASSDSKMIESAHFKMKKVECAEDDDFMSAFDNMLADNILERTRESSRPQTHINVPVHVKSTAKKTYEQLLTEELEEKSRPVVNFVLLTKVASNKQHFTNVEMPVDSELVTKLRTMEEADKAERDRVKQLTLEINERQEEEEAMELLQQAQRPGLVNLNRDRRPRYQHPKGAPDADLIFGTKKAR